MASFKGNGRNSGSNRRRANKPSRRRDFLFMEPLEERRLLATWHPTNTNLADIRNGPMANEGQDLVNLYQAYLHTGGNPTQIQTQFPLLQFKNGSVLVGVNSSGGDFNTFKNSLTNLGMQTVASSAFYGLVEGYLPLSQLPTVAEMTQTLSAHPIYRPSVKFVGAANNEAETSLFANVARTQFGVDGTGVTVGVISDSASQFGNGLADSVGTGDLPQGVKIIQDGPAGSTDEGRAMMENIHDIAPGAALQFATAFISELGFAQNIQALANAGSNLIVDDVSYFDEPMFQDGIVAQAVNNVTAGGVTYFSAAGNQQNSGYLSNFRATSASVGSLGAGTYMNFDPGSGVTTQMPITISGASGTNAAIITMEFDQPYKTQQPASSTAAPTSELDLYVLDSSGNIVASSTNNNVATGAPIQQLTVTSNGNFFVVMKLVSGPAPGHVEFVDANENTTMLVSPQFGSNGGTFYPTSQGHETAINTIGVAATPWWAPAPYLAQNPLKPEPFSSYGPGLYVLDSNGNPLSSPVISRNPTITAPDGGNTSFFPPGGIIDTSNAPFPGEPSTPTNLSQNLPSFFGTSSASPNATAIAALMLQKAPNLKPADIRAALIASASPVNGTPAGTWDQQGGFGMINAIKAIEAADVLRVASTSPGNGATLTVSPSGITFTFNKQVDFSTVKASDLKFTAAPTGVTVTVGTPIAIDNPKFPTVIVFPFSFATKSSTQLANGTYAYTLSGSIASADTKTLAPFSSKFTLNDTTAPRVVATAVNGRVVSAQFNEAMRPSSITPQTVYLAYVKPDGTTVNLNTDPRAKISYNPVDFTVTLDYSALSQTQMPSGNYKLVILGASTANGPSVLSMVGNKLNGAFSGTFPSGVDPTKANPTPHGDFIQPLGPFLLQAPVITSFQVKPSSDTGIANDNNSSVNNPVLIGQVSGSFPGSIAGLTVLVEFDTLHGGNLDLAVGGNGRGFVGHFDAQATTNADGTFTVNTPFLPEGFQRVALVVVGQPDAPPLPGLASSFFSTFRIDRTGPQISGASFAPGGALLPLGSTNVANISSLTGVSLNAVDVSNPATGFLATPGPVLFPALDPSSVANVSNYSLINTTTNVDESSFIATATFVPTGANFVSPQNRTLASDPYFGRIDLTFLPGLPQGHYKLIARTTETVGGVKYSGLTDAAGNALDDTSVTGKGDFEVEFNFQSQATFVTGMSAVSSYQGNNDKNQLIGVVGGPRSYYEQVSASTGANSNPTLNAPPGAFVFDFSNALATTAPDGSPIDFADAFQLIRSANTSTSPSDGDFGNLGVAGQTSTGNGFTRVPVTVTLYDPPADKTAGLGVAQGASGFDPLKATRVVVSYSGVLPADYYKIYAPNVAGTDTQLYDIYGNQFDGEFLANQDSFNNWKDLLPNGQLRSGLSGDAVPGGDFMTGFVVAKFGNIIYARPGYRENPLEASTQSVGTLTNPYSVLAPQDAPGSGPANPSHDPNGGQNATSNFFNFDSRYDRAGIGTFARSAFYAASQLAFNGSPVVLIGLPGIPTLNPVTGKISTPTFVLQAPSGSDPIVNNGSASVPFNTTFVLQAGSILKMQNASLFVQNQGSAFQALGGSSPSDQINITSYANAAIGGATNPASQNPRSGDFGGIVYRSIDQAAYPNLSFPIDGKLVGPNGTAAVSGENDSMSIINNTNISFGGGSVPQTIGLTYGAVTLFNARPALTNLNISKSGQTGGGNTGSAVGAITADLDSFRADDTAMGALIRNVSVSQNGLNGIWLLPEFTGVVEPTNAIPLQDNPVTMGGSQNYVFNAQLPFILTSRLDVGQMMLQGTGGSTVDDTNRLSILPGQMLKFQHGAGIEVLTPGSSLIVGDQSYIRRWDAEATINPVTGLPQSPYSPAEAGYVYDNQNSANVVFTSLYDNKATTTYIDPTTGLPTTIVPAIDSANSNGAFQPIAGGNVPDQARWGSITYFSGAYGVFNNAEVEFGGGAINIAGGTVTRNALSFLGATGGGFFFNGTTFVQGEALGTRVMVTNNSFHDNVDTPVAITPDGLLATDPLTPLSSGHFFMRNNVMKNNTFNGLGVLAPFRGVGSAFNFANLDVDSVWDLTDVTYFLRGSVVLGSGNNSPFFFPGINQNDGLLGNVPTTLAPIPAAGVTLTLQAALPGTLLPNGQSIPKPGEPLLVKLQNQPGAPAPLTPAQTATANILESYWEGAGFIAGVDNGIDPTADSLLDPGVNSQLRILGIGGNETTGQTRIPVIITSAFDNTVGTTVSGVKMFQLVTGSTQQPAAGDGGLIVMGGNSLTNYNMLDPRQGNIIQNADIRDISHIEVIGGGITDTWDINKDNSFTIADDPGSQKTGIFPGQFAKMQYNAAKQYVIADNNFANFRDAGVVANAGFAMIAVAEDYVNNPSIYRSSFGGLPYHLFMYNNSIANMPTGVLLQSQSLNNTGAPSPEMAVFLNNTFYNNAIAIDSEAPQFNGQNSLSHVTFLAMDNIFSNSSTAAINIVGMDWNTQGQYNLFWQNATNVNAGSSSSGFPNNQPIFGNPQFRDPANLDFGLQANSAAIDQSISEFGPTLFGDMLYPIATQVLNQTGGVRNSFGNTESDLGGLGGSTDSRDLVTLAGFPIRDYVDEWIPVLASDSTGIAGPESNASTWNFAPLSGERDLLGNLRQKDPNSPNVGFGSRPYFDIGAYEYRQFFPPHITDVKATILDPANPSNSIFTPIYSVNGIAGVNQTPQTIQFKIDEDLAQNTVNGNTVLLEGSGGTGIFNGSQFNKFYSLAGKVSFDPSTDILTVNLAAAGLTLSNDEYRIVLLGTGSTVIADPEGNALDGQNTKDDDPNNPQLALPSGTGFPGSNFYLTFIVNDQGSSIVPGSLKLDPKSDTHATDGITFNSQPSFSGTITDPDPAIDPLGGQTVIVDVSTKGLVTVNGKQTIVWDVLNAGSGTTSPTGQFTVQINSPLKDSSYNVGPDGLLNSPLNKSLYPKTQTSDTNDSGYTYVRVRVIDAAGNVSNEITDSLADFQANGAVTKFVVDTKAPQVTSFAPKANSLISPDPTTGKVTFTIGLNKNIDLATLTSSSVLVTRSGKDGVFGTADDVKVAIDAGSFKLTPLKNGALGPERLTFTISQGLVNDQYQVTLLGTGNSPVLDIAGNALDGAGNGKAGSDFNSSVVIYNPNAVHTVFVGGPAFVSNPAATAGTRANPFPTIQAGINAATTGDVVAVLPGVYNENVTLKALVRVRSAAIASTDGNWLPGNALATVIRAPSVGSTSPATVSATNLRSVPGLDTEIAGFTITSPLIGDAALGAIDPVSIGLLTNNSNVLIDKNYFIDSNNGIQVIETGLNPIAPRINDNVFAGNIDGLYINGNDPGLVMSLTNQIQIKSNDFVFNTVGLYVSVNQNPPLMANVVNNIFWANHDLTPSRNGEGIFATHLDAMVVRHSLFQSNGASDTNASGSGVNVGNGFDPLHLGPIPDTTFGNYTGNPAFISPRDPRPGSDGPASFFLDANFDITQSSAAIDGASKATPAKDLLYRSHFVDILGRSFQGSGPGFPTGPADVGAFEFQGASSTGGTAVGGSFRVTTDSLSPTGKAIANGGAVNAANFPKSFTITFSNDVNKSTLTASDIQLSGNGINSSAPLKVSSLSWIDSHTVRVMLSGYVNSTGTVSITLPAGSVKNTVNGLLPRFKDSVTLYGTAPKPPAPPAPTAPPPAPAPVPSPTGGHKNHAKAVVHPKTVTHSAVRPRGVIQSVKRPGQ